MGYCEACNYIYDDRELFVFDHIILCKKCLDKMDEPYNATSKIVFKKNRNKSHDMRAELAGIAGALRGSYEPYVGTDLTPPTGPALKAARDIERLLYGGQEVCSNEKDKQDNCVA